MVSLDDLELHQDLRHPRNPTKRLPWRLRRLLPNPLHEEGRHRYQHTDLPALALGALKAERVSLVVAMAALDFEEVPAWALEREARITAELAARLGSAGRPVLDL